MKISNVYLIHLCTLYFFREDPVKVIHNNQGTLGEVILQEEQYHPQARDIQVFHQLQGMVHPLEVIQQEELTQQGVLTQQEVLTHKHPTQPTQQLEATLNLVFNVSISHGRNKFLNILLPIKTTCLMKSNGLINTDLFWLVWIVNIYSKSLLIKEI